MRRFKGMSSKYLNNYLVWNNKMEGMKTSLAEKAASALRRTASTLFEEICRALPKRPAIPSLVEKQSGIKLERKEKIRKI